MAEKLNLKQKLVEIRKSVGILQKTETGNKGAKYVDPAVIILKIREAMDSLGVLLTLQVSASKMSQVPAPTKNDANNIDFLSESELVYTWYDADSDESIEGKWFAVASHMQDPSMAFGGALTYSERYFMLKFFQVPTTKDDPEFLRAKSGVIDLVTTEQVMNIEALIGETKADKIKFMAVMSVDKLEDIYASNYNLAISKLEAKRDYGK